MNSILKNIQDFWSNIGLNQRLVIAAAGAAALILVVVLFNWASEPNMNFLIGKVAPSDMAQIVNRLDEKAIKYKTKEIDGSGYIYVAADKDTTARLRLELIGEGLPGGDSVGFEIFDRNNFGISDFAQRTNFVRATQGELARTISQIKGIKSARVQAVVPENKLLITDPSSRAKASVFIDSGNTQINESQVNSIRSLVSNSIEGVAMNDVTVIDNHGNHLTEGLGEDGLLGGRNALKAKESLEKYYSTQIVKLMTPIVGIGNVVARVSVEIDNTAETFLEEKFDPEGQVVRSQTTDEDKLQSTEGKTQEGGVGAAANIPAANNDADSEPSILSQTDETRKTKNTQYEINRSLREQVQNPGGISDIRAAVLINKKGDGVRSSEQIEDFRMVVANALGIDLSPVKDNKFEMDNRVSVKEVEFSESAAIAGGVGMNAFDEFKFKYGEEVKQMFAAAIILGLFIYFLRMVKKFKPKSDDVQIMDELDSGKGRPGQLETNLTPELLNDLIQEKPENVSTALKTWMEDRPNN